MFSRACVCPQGWGYLWYQVPCWDGYVQEGWVCPWGKNSSPNMGPQRVSMSGVGTHPLPTHGTSGVCPGVGYSPPPSPEHNTWDTTGYGRQAHGTHPTRMLSCSSYFVWDIHHVVTRHTILVIRRISFHWEKYFAPFCVRNAIADEVIRHSLCYSLLVLKFQAHLSSARALNNESLIVVWAKPDPLFLIVSKNREHASTITNHFTSMFVMEEGGGRQCWAK